ncbi:MAG: methylated-DNA--[Clostridia bacterium]|nr:methylated-DNA--[protein]-cysteine S-methyltransferase [Clostridia bacterium]
MEIGCSIQTPFGIWVLTTDGERLTRFVPGTVSPGAKHDPQHPLLKEASAQLDAYFNGRLSTFSLPLSADGTPFQKAVWEQLTRIPYGQTRTYGEIASEIGRASAARAVGNACGQNPLLIFIPCHRVIAVHGNGGYRAGPLAKAGLLTMETRYFAKAVDKANKNHYT